MKLVHLINPVKAGGSSDLISAQPITFESLRVAKAFVCESCEVLQATTQYPEDHEIIPDYFVKLSDLKESVLDYGRFNASRKLPLIREILEKALQVNDVDYVVYSNVDIAVNPHFYSFVNFQINRGLEAFIINRRTIPRTFSRIDELPLMYSCVGKKHPGYDCFVFKREFIERMILHSICIGAPYIGLALYLNLRVLARTFKVFEDEHLTFHIGDEKAWKEPSGQPFADHNRKEFEKVKTELSRYANVESIIRSAFPKREN